DYLVTSHLHPDHATGLAAIARNFKIKEYLFTENYEVSTLHQEINQALGKRVKRTRIVSGLELNPVEGIEVRFIYPDEPARAAFKPGNDLSAVLRLNWKKVSFLFTGDITAGVEEYLINQQKARPQLKATIMKVPHHGSRSSSTADFLKTVSPALAVVSCGRRNIYGFPAREVLSRYKAEYIQVYRTDLDGAVEFKTDGQRLSWKTARSKISLGFEAAPSLYPD
ncbi:MAG TPA: MBL fold metallo-hydrolase, partial [Candidatus Saccharicenans sp.]|nr:MBL fold metallo-hydrolase [Candidatus Saccharicenans sp.]